MVEHLEGIQGMWWLFSDYHIYEPPWTAEKPAVKEYFRYVRPTPGSELETYDISLSSTKTSLVAESCRSFLALDLEDEAAILDWCRRYGLLGILPESTVLVRLKPRWKFLSDAPQSRQLVATQREHIRTHVGWSPIDRRILIKEGEFHIVPDDEHRLEDYLHRLVDPGDTTLPEPQALTSVLFHTRYEQQTLAQSVGRFFPGVPTPDLEIYQYPTPLSDPFWCEYAEPLENFRSAARGFRDMLDGLRLNTPLNELPLEAQRRLLNSRSQLHALLSVSPALGFQEDGTFTPKWAFSSLLAIFAFAIRQDLLGGKTIRHCKRPKCRTLFLTGQGNREYCSSRCRQAEEKARQRRSKRSG